MSKSTSNSTPVSASASSSAPSFPSSSASTPVSTPVRRVGGGGGPGEKKGKLDDLDLATGIDRLPEFWNRHGNKVLIGITIVALGYALWSFRHNSAIAARENNERSLASARELLIELRTVPLGSLTSDQYSSTRKRIYSDATTYLMDVLGRSEDSSLLAQALLLRGDLNYTLANMPETDDAATRPSCSARLRNRTTNC
jgi:hypothetical protein